LRVSGLTAPSYVDNAVSGNSAYRYQVMANLAGGGAVASNTDLATTVTFDSTLSAGSPIRLTHVNQLTTIANAVRSLAGLGGIAFTNAPSAGGIVRASHVTDLRAGITAARSVLFLSPPSFTRTVTSGVSVLATDFTEARSALQ
jgi:hypothetical protein